MKVPKQSSIFNQQGRSVNIVIRIVLIVVILIGGYIGLNSEYLGTGNMYIEPFFKPTPESTRTSDSFILESQAHLASGDLDESIKSLENALEKDPNNVPVLIELARIQTYFSAIKTNQDSIVILGEALENIDLAISLDDTNSDAFAVHAFVNDWNAGYAETSDERDSFLTQAQQSAQKALSLDVTNVLANVYRAEILGDQGRLTQAFQIIEEAVAANPNLMDAHRVYAFLYESTGSVNYRNAIEEYKLAAEIMPNFTYLYIKIGQNYRELPVPLYDLALEYFDRAATINEVLELADPLPYVAIAKTYIRQGEFFIAARNMQKALDFDPTNAQLYGELGVIYFQSRNYEGSIPVLKCAVEGCLAEENEEQEISVVGQDLKNSTVIYYYTYGSVLAALDECQRADVVLNQVGDVFASDEIIMGIVEDGLFICR